MIVLLAILAIYLGIALLAYAALVSHDRWNWDVYILLALKWPYFLYDQWRQK